MLPAYTFCPNNSDLVDASAVDHYPQHPIYLDIPPPLLRPPTPFPDTDLAFTPISQHLTTRRVDPNHTQDSMLDYYATTSQHLFPTPSELLSNINHRPQPCPRDISESRPYGQPSPPPPQTRRQQTPDAGTTTAPLNNAVNKTESQRKARQRAIAEEIGFNPTDPYVSRLPCFVLAFQHLCTRDTISSHEKKRHYLECLEQYVLYLHEQLRLVHTAPLALERVSTYRGLSSRSIRTLLVHMQNTNKTLHEGTLVGEQVVRTLEQECLTWLD